MRVCEDCYLIFLDMIKYDTKINNNCNKNVINYNKNIINTKSNNATNNKSINTTDVKSNNTSYTQPRPQSSVPYK